MHEVYEWDECMKFMNRMNECRVQVYEWDEMKVMILSKTCIAWDGS